MKKGISLITLIISIIVIIILAGAIILAISKNNPFESAKEAVFKGDISTIQEQLNVYVADQFLKTAGEFDSNTMNGKVSDYLSNLTKYDDKIKVLNGKISYIGNNVNEETIVVSIGGEQELVQVNRTKIQ